MSTWGFGLLSVAVAVPLILISETVLELAVVALGIPVCFYYGSTGLASIVYYRREVFDSARKFVLVGLLPLLGGAIMYAIGIYAIIYYGHKENAEGKQYLGLTLPAVVRRDRHGRRVRGDARLAALLPPVLLAQDGNGRTGPARCARSSTRPPT